MNHTSGYWSALLLCRESGRRVESRVGAAREIENLSFEITPYNLPRRRNMRRELGYMEFCQFITGAYDEAEIARVAPNVDMKLFGRSAIYGPRVCGSQTNTASMNIAAISFRDQIADVIRELRRFPNSRRAVISIHNPNEPLDDQPCLSLLQFQIRDERLSVTAYFRSWDLWFGAPHDLIVVSAVSQVIAACVLSSPQDVSQITALATNAHIYERSIDAVSGPSMSWTFDLLHLPTIGQYRTWAARVRTNSAWVSGKMPGVAYENFPKVPDLEAYNRTPIHS